MDEMAIDRLGIVKLLTQLKDHKACGPDLLPTKIPNEAAEPVYIFLKAIFVKSLSSGTLPRDWKLSNITPVYKKGDISKPTNYRPISLTCVCSKLMDHIIVSNVMSHFTNSDVGPTLWQTARLQSSSQLWITTSFTNTRASRTPWEEITDRFNYTRFLQGIRKGPPSAPNGGGYGTRVSKEKRTGGSMLFCQTTCKE